MTDSIAQFLTAIGPTAKAAGQVYADQLYRDRRGVVVMPESSGLPSWFVPAAIGAAIVVGVLAWGGKKQGRRRR